MAGPPAQSGHPKEPFDPRFARSWSRKDKTIAKGRVQCPTHGTRVSSTIIPRLTDHCLAENLLTQSGQPAQSFFPLEDPLPQSSTSSHPPAASIHSATTRHAWRPFNLTILPRPSLSFPTLQVVVDVVRDNRIPLPFFCVSSETHPYPTILGSSPCGATITAVLGSSSACL